MLLLFVNLAKIHKLYWRVYLPKLVEAIVVVDAAVVVVADVVVMVLVDVTRTRSPHNRKMTPNQITLQLLSLRLTLLILR